jgi:uncharacterized protein (TIGR03083 family)
VDHLDYCDALEVEISRFADVLEKADFASPVPGCPDWSVGDLTLHLGTVHRWAERLVATAAAQRQSPKSMGLVLEPVNPLWIRDGGAALLEALRHGDPTAPMWTWGADQHLGWWSRRQLHETLVHRTDLEAASGITSQAPAQIAADAIDEFLGNLESAAAFSPLVRDIRGAGEVLEITTDDTDKAWSVQLTPDAFEISSRSESSDAQLSGLALDVLLVLYRRIPLPTSRVTSSGSQELVRFWLNHSALQ